MKKKIVRRRRRIKRSKTPGKHYFTAETQDAIEKFQKAESNEEKSSLYTKDIMPAFDKLAENLILIYGKIQYKKC